MDCKLPLQKTFMEGVVYEAVVGGLLGGHSGAEIHKERGNSNCLFGRLLWNVTRKIPVGLVSVKGGLADNAISRETKAMLVLRPEDTDLFVKIVKETEKEIAEELATKDPDFFVQVKEGERGSYDCVTTEATKKVAAFLLALPNGVQGMSADMPGLVETSLNMGILDQREDGVHTIFALRSSVESAKNALVQKVAAIVQMAGGSCDISGDYPGWKYRVDSPLREKMIALYEKMYGKLPKVEAIHAGLECGLLGSKITDLDCVSFGPQMRDIHTTEETMSISSVKRSWEFILQILAKA